jgi:hypothetical protein
VQALDPFERSFTQKYSNSQSLSLLVLNDRILRLKWFVQKQQSISYRLIIIRRSGLIHLGIDAD